MTNKLILEKKASRFRNTLGLGSEDSITLKSLLYKLNVLTVFKPLSDSFSGMAIRVGDGESAKRFILINSSQSLGKQHFTICHELYHLFVQENFSSMVCNTGLFPLRGGEELNADLFAAYFLLPENGVKSLIPDQEFDKNKISLKTILKIEQYFSCSRAALLYRLKDLKLIDSTGYDRFNCNIKKSAVQHGYRTSIYEPGNHNIVVGDYGTLARELFELGKITESHYFSLLFDLGMSAEDIQVLEDENERKGNNN